ncbi:Yip1 family protein [Roseococcus sp. YIM B11640]|uniref:Yip1 family protein n=1 Tax=Roseococcus sp. YIM B11640 TaxID=3133973 RepID=UPI003C7DF632
MNLVARAKGLLVQPKDEWRAVAAEPADTASLYTSYIIPLSAIPAVTGFIAVAIIGAGVVTMGSLLVSSILSYILGLVGVFVLAKIVEFLAPKFGAPQDGGAAFKLAAYAPTASWVAGIGLLIPFIGWLIALAGALYSIYLFYVGGPIVARVPPERMVPFTIAVFIVAIIVQLVIGLIIAAVI